MMLCKDLFIYFAQFNDVSEMHKLWKLNNVTKQYFDNPFSKKVFKQAIDKKYNKSVNRNLYHCVRNKDYFLVNHFIDNGATDFNLAMASAATNNNLEMVQLMIKKGADKFDRAIMHAVWKNNLEIINFFIKNYAIHNNTINKIMKRATKNNNLEMV